MYCAKCGVKLAASEQVCPLCGLKVYHPELPAQQAQPPYPLEAYPAARVRPKAALIILTAAFLLPFFITLQCDLLINRAVTWSGYVAGGLVVSYVVMVLPFWFVKPNPAVFIPLDFAAACLYLCYINFACGGNWFMTFALPVTAAVGVITTAVTALLRYLWKGRLYIIGGGFLALGLFMPVMEYLLCLTFSGLHFWGWSVFPLTAAVLLGGVLIFLAICRPARENMERKFFL